MKYCDSAEARRASFTPIIASCEGIFDHQAMVYMKRLSTLLASKWEKSYSLVHGCSKQECKSVFYAPLAYVSEDQELNGEELELNMVLRYHCTLFE